MMALGGVAGVTTVQCGFKDACVVGAVTITEQNRGGGLVLWTPGVVFAHFLTAMLQVFKLSGSITVRDAIESAIHMHQANCPMKVLPVKALQSAGIPVQCSM